MTGYPRGFLTVLVVTFATVTASGLLLVPTLLDFRFDVDVVWRLPGAQRTAVAALHTGTALALCGLVGALWAVHARIGWRSGRRLRSGLTTSGLIVGTALTAVGLLYFGDETWLESASAAHTLFGIGGAMLAAFHWWLAVAERARSRVGADRTRVAGERGTAAEPISAAVRGE